MLSTVILPTVFALKFCRNNLTYDTLERVPGYHGVRNLVILRFVTKLTATWLYITCQGDI